jgi:hypothetical protein
MATMASEISPEYSKGKSSSFPTLVCQEALKRALRIYLNETNHDMIRIRLIFFFFSHTVSIYKKLIQLSPKREISLGYYNDVKYVLNESKASLDCNSCVNQLKWFMSDSWNNGIYYYKFFDLF